MNKVRFQIAINLEVDINFEHRYIPKPKYGDGSKIENKTTFTIFENDNFEKLKRIIDDKNFYSLEEFLKDNEDFKYELKTSKINAINTEIEISKQWLELQKKKQYELNKEAKQLILDIDLGK